MPTEAEIQSVVTNPQRWFLEPTLRQSEVVRGNLDLLYPVDSSPHFWVFKFKAGNQFFAYRFFEDTDSKGHHRYERLAVNFKEYGSSFIDAGLSRPPWLNLHYFPEAYETPDSNSEKFPIIRMDWSDGDTLIDFLCQICQTTEEDTRETAINQLETLCRNFVRMLNVMHQIKMAHGNLSGTSIKVKVEDNSLILVEYGQMYFDDGELTLFCEPDELPNSHFQHPRAKNERKYNERMDDFSAFLIILALTALKVELSTTDDFEMILEDTLFWYLDERKEDTILFKKNDLETPNTSEVFKILRELHDPTVNKLVKIVENACAGSVSEVPPFAPTIETVLDPIDKLRHLIDEQPRDWEAIYAEIQRLEASGVDLPDDPGFTPIIAEARERFEAHEKLRVAVEEHPPSARAIVDAWNDAGKNSCLWEKETKQAEQQVAKLDELDSSEEVDAGHRETVRLYESCRSLLSGCKENQAWGAKVNRWKEQIEACDTLLPLINVPLPWPSDIAVADAWAQLESTGSHADYEAVRDRVEADIKRCRERSDCLRKVRATLDPGQNTNPKMVLGKDGLFGEAELSDEITDRRFTECWNDSLLRDCPDVQVEERSKYTAAKERIGVVDKVNALISELDTHGNGNEQQIVDAAEQLPAEYTYAQAERVAIAKNRGETETALEIAWTAPISDIALAGAHEAFQRYWADASHRPQYDSAKQSRIDRAIKRQLPLSLLQETLLSTHRDQDLDEANDLLLKKHWDSDLFTEPPESTALCADASAIQRRIDAAIGRINAVANIRSAIQEIDQLHLSESNGTNRSNQGEAFIVQQVHESGLEEMYLQRLQQDTYARIVQARKRSELSERLIACLKQSAPSDIDIARAWEALLGAGGDPLVAVHKSRAELACLRRDGLNNISQLLQAKHPLDAEDHELLAFWEGHRLNDCLDATNYTERVGLATNRTTQWSMLENAIQSEDDFAITERFNEPLSVFYPPVRERLAEIQSAISRATPAIDFLETLKEDSSDQQRKRFVELFSPEHFRNYPSHFEDFIEQIKERQNELFACYTFTRNTFYQTLKMGDEGRIRVHWNWRNEAHFSSNVISKAVIKVSNCPIETTTSNNSPADNMNEITEAEYSDNDASCLLQVPEDWHGSFYVAIWPVIQFTCGEHSIQLQPEFPPVQLHTPWPPTENTEQPIDNDPPDDHQNTLERIISKIFAINEK